MKGSFAILLGLLILGGCSNFKDSSNRIVVARAGDNLLYQDQLPGVSGVSVSAEDSISIIRNYIDRWIKKELLVMKAEVNLSTEYQAEINQKLSETRANLMIYQYQQQMIFQRMDTTVSDSEIDSYYNENISTMVLSSAIVKALFIKIPIEAPNIDRVRQWYRSSRQEDMQNLESYCYQFADKFDDFGEEWLNLNFLLRELPTEISDHTRFLANNSYYETSDPSYYYFVNFRDSKAKGEAAPIEYLKGDIKNIILNNRKIKFLQELENGIYNEALRENSFKIF
jgi:hypothetical protein